LDGKPIGAAAAKKRGKHVGRPPKLTPQQIAHARSAIDGGMQNMAGNANAAGMIGFDYW
jgi:DNA invertase Pin-like site-specific DNA recombinase